MIATHLGGAIDSRFWTVSILQLSHVEPAIRQGLIAISNLWELQIDRQAADSDDLLQRHAEMYNKALTVTAQRVSQPEAETVALATCVIFLCLHCLKGDVQQAKTLLKTGSAVLNKVISGLCDPAGRAKNETAEIFLPIFERLLVLLRLFGYRGPHFRSPEAMLYDDLNQTFSRFDSLDHARSALFWLASESHELITLTRNYKLSPETNDLDESMLYNCILKQAIQLDALAAWLEAFEQLCRAENHRRKSDAAYEANLRLTHAVTFIWLSTCLNRDEAAFDEYIDSFRIIVQQAAVIVTQNVGPSPPFTFEMSVIPPLYLTAQKCRDPLLRREALSVLSRAPPREGLWDREEPLRIAKRVIDLETNGGYIKPTDTMFAGARICDAHTFLIDEAGAHVKFAAKLQGRHEVWMEWCETIPFQEVAGWSPGSSFIAFNKRDIVEAVPTS